MSVNGCLWCKSVTSPNLERDLMGWEFERWGVLETFDKIYFGFFIMYLNFINILAKFYYMNLFSQCLIMYLFQYSLFFNIHLYMIWHSMYSLKIVPSAYSPEGYKDITRRSYWLTLSLWAYFTFFKLKLFCNLMWWINYSHSCPILDLGNMIAFSVFSSK